MRVLLVRPKPPKHTLGLKNIMICEPLELEYLAAGLGNHNVKIVDEIMGAKTPDVVRQFKPDVVGTSSYITGVNEVRRICRTAKRYNPGILTVVGGVHASVVPEDFCRAEIDMIVLGEGIETLQDMVNRLEQGRDLTEIPGVAFPDGESLRMGPPRAFEQETLERLPFPRRDLTAHYRSKYYYLYHRPVTIMKTAFGCPFRCTFCFCWKITNGRHLIRSPESIADELENIETDEVYIVDDTFLLERERLLEIVEVIRRRNIRKKYLVYGRSDFIAANEDVISEWADIGLKAVIVGVEYTSDHELDSVNKRITKDENDTAIEILRRNRIDIYASFILGMEYDRRDFKRLGEYIEKKQLFYFVLQPLTPLPGTEIFKKYEHLLTVDRESYPLWDLTHVVMRSRLTPRQFYWQMAAIYVRYTANFLRVRKLGLRTVQNVFTYDFLRLMVGAYRILISLLKAHKHHRIYRKNSSPPRSINTLYSKRNFDGFDVNFDLTEAESQAKFKCLKRG
jgi:radical SAM superfamily enzyme YgiQ (UPF0313 family)